MISSPPLVDSFGNIHLHMEEDLVVPVQGDASVGDLSERDLLFVIGPVRHVPRQHSHEPTWREINLKSSELRSVRTGDTFALIDRTGGVAKTRWEGVVTRRP